MTPHAPIAITASVLIVVLAFAGTIPTYAWRRSSCCPCWGGLFALRRRLHLHAFHFALFAK